MNDLTAPTPEVDAVADSNLEFDEELAVVTTLARRLERDRNRILGLLHDATCEGLEQSRLLGMSGEREARLIAERDALREELDDWQNSAKFVEEPPHDEVHCGCVPILRKLLKDARAERDEANLAKSFAINHFVDEIVEALGLPRTPEYLQGVVQACREMVKERDEANLAKSFAINHFVDEIVEALGLPRTPEYLQGVVQACREMVKERDEANLAKSFAINHFVDEIVEALGLPRTPEYLQGVVQACREMVKGRDEAQALAAQMSAEREHNAMQSLMWREVAEQHAADSQRFSREANSWREVAENLIDYAREALVKLEGWGKGYPHLEREMDSIREDIARFDKLKRESK